MSHLKRPYLLAGPVQTYICHRNIDLEIAALHDEGLRIVELAVHMAALPVAADLPKKRESIRTLANYPLYPG